MALPGRKPLPEAERKKRRAETNKRYDMLKRAKDSKHSGAEGYVKKARKSKSVAKVLEAEQNRAKTRQFLHEERCASLGVSIEVPSDPVEAAERRRILAGESSKVQLLTADQEYAARVLARRRLLHFVERFFPGYQAGWVHKDICRRLERFLRDVEAKKSPRLLMLMPPRTGKSTLGSRFFPSWVLGHHPDWEFISAAHSQTLATGFSRQIRELLRDPRYQKLFPATKLGQDSQAVEKWTTTAAGGYVAAGVGTGITGMGANILMIDDPVKDMEAADSAIIREATWGWYMSTAFTRLAPGGGVLGIMTHWNDDDWAGRIQVVMDSGDGEQFEIVRYPAINEGYDEYLLNGNDILEIAPGKPAPEGAVLLRVEGSALHPERYDIDYLKRIRANFNASGQRRVWSALYQQRPTPEEGAFFTKEMMKYYSSPPARSECNVYQAWDFAITTKQSSDWTVCSTQAQDQYDTMHETGLVRFRSDDGFVIIDAILDEYLKHKPDLVGFEDGQIWKSLKSLFERRCQERRIYPSYEVLQPLTDKMVRAGPLRGRMQMGKVRFPQEHPLRRESELEMLRFPASKHDDIVDARAWCTRLALTRQAPRARIEAPIKSWKDDIDKLTSATSTDISHMAA